MIRISSLIRFTFFIAIARVRHSAAYVSETVRRLEREIDRTTMILAGDVGGTKCNLGLFRGRALPKKLH